MQAATIPRRAFGRTELQVSEVGFGAAEMGYEQAGDRVASELLNTALDAGVNVVDTAACYPDSEEMIGRTVAHRRHEFHLITKCGHASGLPTPDWHPQTITASVERSLKRLRTDRLDVVFLHSCPEETLRRGHATAALARCRDAGMTRYIGYSGDSSAARYAVASGAFDCLEISVSIADQEAIESVLPDAQKAGMGIVAKRPLANAAWKLGDRPPSDYARPYFERLRVLDYDFLRGDMHAAVAAALAFALAAPGVCTALLGTKSPGRLRQNLEIAAAMRPDPALYERIRERWDAVKQPGWTGQT